jgi:hypothetical protein
MGPYKEKQKQNPTTGYEIIGMYLREKLEEN